MSVQIRNNSTVREESIKWPQFFITISASVAIFTSGLHTGWPAPSLPKLLSDDYPFDVTSSQASYVTVIGFVGNLCGGLLGSTVLDKIGRKNTILLIAFPQIISFSLIVLSYYVMELLYLARYIGGVAEGMSYNIIPLYIAEIADPNIRGVLGTLIAVTCMFGMLYVNLVGSCFSINVSALSFLIFPIIFILLCWRMPESPYYLLMKNQQEKAKNVLKSLRKKENVREELQTLAKHVDRQMSESGSFKDIFTIDSNRKAFFVMVGLRLVQQLTGFAAFSVYIQILLAQANTSLAPYIGASILLLAELTMAGLSMFFIDRWGRRPLLILSASGCCTTLLIQAVYFGLKEDTDLNLLGLGSVVNILNSEVFSASVKGKAVCLTNAFFAMFLVCTVKFYQVTDDAFGLTVPYSCFGIFTMFGIVFIYFCVPETKGKALEEIQQQFKRVKKTVTIRNINSTTV